MILLLEEAAAASPDAVAVVTSEGRATYGQLLEDARRVTAGLEARQVARFAVLEPDAAWVIRLLAGAALAGAEPCQYQPDTDPAEFAQQAHALGHTVVVTRRNDLHLDVGFEVIRPTELTALQPTDVVAGRDREQPLLIRTTGTTGTPKAARHDWRVLERTVSTVRPTPDERWLLAYGPQQFAGIQVLLHALASRSTLVAPFPRQPKDGLRAMTDQGVTSVSATPTFWRFLLAEARSCRIELPPLRQITLGGEATSTDLLDELRATFPQARVSQVYASTEMGSIISVTDGRAGIAEAALYSDANPTSNLRVENGELWVRAAAGMLGYVGEVETGARVDWCPTGDLVTVTDGRVHFQGRDSEVINVGGVKIHPLPIEERITGLETVAAARVYGRPNKLTGAIVAADIVLFDLSTDTDVIRGQIAQALADLPRAAQPRSISFVEGIESVGGKTVRREAVR